jgi:hypothetical protein
LARALTLNKPVVRARYEYGENPANGLGAEIDQFVARFGLLRSKS